MNRHFASKAALVAVAIITLPALPSWAAQDTSASAAEPPPAVVQGDHDFLQRLESHMPDSPAAPARSAPPAVAAPSRAASRPVPPAIAEERAPAPASLSARTEITSRRDAATDREVATVESAPMPTVTKPARTAPVKREATVSANSLPPAPRREIVTRPTRVVTATRTPVTLDDDAAIDEIPGATVRIQRPYVVEQPPVVQRRFVYPGEEVEVPDTEYVEIHTQHHGFFHRLFRRHD